MSRFAGRRRLWSLLPDVSGAVRHRLLKMSTRSTGSLCQPGDDFYLYAKGGWLKAVPAERDGYDDATILNEKTATCGS